MASKISNEIIKEIAEELDCGFRCYLNKTTHVLITIPDSDKLMSIDMSIWATEINEVEKNFHNYFEIEQLDPGDSFVIMEQFANSLKDSNELKKLLLISLTKQKPFREFKFIIDNSGDYRQKWFAFKKMKLEEWVINRLEVLNSTL
jgi:hypothetical protein